MTKGEETRQLIIGRSAPVFNKKGIAATTMSDIMEVTRLSKGSLYVHFENKEVLASSVVDYNMEILAKKVMSAINRHANPKEKLFAYLDVFIDPLHSPVAGGCPMMNFGAEADDTNEEIRKKVALVVEASQQMIANIIKQGIKEGVFNPGWNYKEFATLLFALIEGGTMISRITGNNSKMKIINRNIRKMIEEQLL
jgi:AcrR family transcriptional regulator